MALAVVASNAIGLVFTIVFARILGASDYGSLAVLVSAWIILMVPGSALQVAVAREISREAAGDPAIAGTSVRRWLERLAVVTVVVAIVAIPLRGVMAAILNVEEEWAAVAVPLSGMLWALVSVERGALQGVGEYRTIAASVIGEAGARLAFALLLVGAGLEVTGAFLGTPLSLAAVGLVLWRPLTRRLPGLARDAAAGLRQLVLGAWAPVLGMSLLFVLQEVHIIVVKHQADSDAAGAYAVAAVAAKAIIWVAVGLGMFLVPEAARRTEAGGEARPVLMRALGLITAFSVPALLIFAVVGEPLLEIAFGDDLTGGADSLPWLGLAMALLACSYLCVQYLLAVHRTSFIAVLAIAAAAEVALVARLGADLEQVAQGLCGLQAVCAATMLAFAARRHARRRDRLAA
jgi:O-antigen/teichoic acid export membrane protein